MVAHEFVIVAGELIEAAVDGTHPIQRVQDALGLLYYSLEHKHNNLSVTKVLELY